MATDIVNYILRLEAKTPESILMNRVREELQQRGFQEMETAVADGFHFVRNAPAYTLQAHLETDAGREYIQRVALSLDARRLPTEAISAVADELSAFACRLAYADNTQQMLILDKAGTEAPHDKVESDAACDLCRRIEQQIRQHKQSLRRFPAVSSEDAQKWMDDFPQRRDRFVAAIREGKD